MCDAWCTVPCGPQGAFGVRERLRAALHGATEVLVSVVSLLQVHVPISCAWDQHQAAANTLEVPGCCLQRWISPVRSHHAARRENGAGDGNRAGSTQEAAAGDVACFELGTGQCVVGSTEMVPGAPTLPQPSALCSITGSLGCWRLLRSWCWWQSHFTTSAVC